MKPISAPTFHILSTPVAPPRAVSHGPAGAPASSHEPAPNATERPAGEGGPRGRSGGYSERVLEMVCAAIREYGLSDSAAAVKTGMSAPTLAQWKREFPEIAVRLEQAREDCRIRHLDIVMRFAQADNACGLRAATWLLERLFPGDYAPRAREREAHRDLETQARERESSDAFYQKLRDEQAERDARFAKADREYKEALAAYEAQQATAEQSGESGAPVGAEDAEIRESAAERDLHNVKNSAAAEAGEAGTHAPASCTASVEPLHNVQNSAAEPREDRPEPVQNSRTASESALHNVQNPGEPALFQEGGRDRERASHTL
ncbi:MAG TPA: hypothetical protein VGO11_03595 [Chthoniobacteraceae bacterium]|nr:hypothetical protein [Chthoniobacteraceae bacterium]